MSEREKKKKKKHTPRRWLRPGGVDSRDGPRQRLRLTAVTGTDQDRRSSKEIGKVLLTYYEGIDKTGFSYNSRLRDNSKQASYPSHHQRRTGCKNKRTVDHRTTSATRVHRYLSTTVCRLGKVSDMILLGYGSACCCCCRRHD